MSFKLDRDTWYSTHELAAFRGCSTKTLEGERWAGNGIPYSRIGKRVFYKGADIEDFLVRRRQRSSSDKPAASQPSPSAKAGKGMVA